MKTIAGALIGIITGTLATLGIIYPDNVYGVFFFVSLVLLIIICGIGTGIENQE